MKEKIDKIYPSLEALEKVLATGKKLKIYHGIDPTGPHLHLGHATNLLVLREFQKLGHRIILLIGDFTARIGDPTDKLSPRQPLTEQQVKDNLKTFKKQAARIIKFTGRNPAQLKFNSRWYAKMPLAEMVKLAQYITIQQLIGREMFQKRMAAGKPISAHEFLYPLLQGYDSVAMDVDMEIGGTDQTFNMLVGRDLMRVLKRKEKFILTTKLLVNPKTGRKLMNKSEGGLINLDDEPIDMFGKVMALPDETIEPVAELSTEMSPQEVRDLKRFNPRDAKLKLAYEIVKLYHSEKAAGEARDKWIKIFSRKEIPDDVPLLKVGPGITPTLLVVRSGVVKSNSEARRLVEQGGLEIDGLKIKNPKFVLTLNNGQIVKIGKKRFFRIKI